MDSAIYHAGKAFSLAPDSKHYLELRSYYLVGAGRYEEAQQDLTLACDRHGNSYCLFAKGTNEGRLGLYKQALDDFNKAIFHEPDNAQYYVGKAFAELMSGALNDSLASVDKAIAMGYSASYLKGVILSRQKREREAIELFNRTVCIDQLPPAKSIMCDGELENQRARNLSEQELREFWSRSGMDRMPTSANRYYENMIIKPIGN
jgi:tetratricopeptide (TPR) repeat protein